MAEHELQVFEDDGGQYRWREALRSESEWEVLSESEIGYATKAAAIEAARQTVEIVDLDEEMWIDED